LSVVTISFAVQKLFSLMQSCLFILFLKCWDFWVFRGCSLDPYVPVYFLLLLVVVSQFHTFYSLIHFELILLQGEDRDLFQCSTCGSTVFPAAFVEEAVFSPLCALGSFVEDHSWQILESLPVLPFNTWELGNRDGHWSIATRKFRERWS
jgi:hypothetical protein